MKFIVRLKSNKKYWLGYILVAVLAVIMCCPWGVNTSTGAIAGTISPTYYVYLWGWQDIAGGQEAQDMLIDSWTTAADIYIAGFELHDESILSYASYQPGNVRHAAFLSTSSNPQDYDKRFGVVNVVWQYDTVGGLSGSPIAHENYILPGEGIFLSAGSTVYLYETIRNHLTVNGSVLSRPRAILYFVTTGAVNTGDIDKIRYWTDLDGPKINRLDIDARYDGVWHSILSIDPTDNDDFKWNEVIIPGGAKAVSGYRVQVRANADTCVARLFEFQFHIVGQAWCTPTSFSDSSGTWNNELNAYDGDTGTRAGNGIIYAGTWGGYLELHP